MKEAVDEQRLEALQGKVMGDIAGAMGVFLAYLGDATRWGRFTTASRPQSVPPVPCLNLWGAA